MLPNHKMIGFFESRRKSFISKNEVCSFDAVDLENLNQEELDAFLSKPDEKGMLPLKCAIEQSDLERVKVLLSLGAPIGEGASSEELFAERENKLNFSALIRTRRHWREIAKKRKIPLEAVIRVIEKTNIKEMETIHDNDGIVTFGVTGHGKSTFVNYLLGVNYKINNDARAEKLNHLNIEKAGVGHSVSSHTHFPGLYLPNKDYVKKTYLIDMPGFSATTGTIGNISTALYTQLFMESLKGIKCILFVCSWDSIVTDPKSLMYRSTAETIGKMISKSPKNVILIITKTEDLSSARQASAYNIVVKRLKELEISLRTESKNALVTTEAILSNLPDSLQISNVTSDSYRNYFFESINKFSPRELQYFNFTNFDEDFSQFIYCMEDIAGQYFNMKMNISTMQKECIAIDKQISEKNKEIDNIVSILPKNSLLSEFISICKKSNVPKSVIAQMIIGVSMTAVGVRNNNASALNAGLSFITNSLIGFFEFYQSDGNASILGKAKNIAIEIRLKIEDAKKVTEKITKEIEDLKKQKTEHEAALKKIELDLSVNLDCFKKLAMVLRKFNNGSPMLKSFLNDFTSGTLLEARLSNDFSIAPRPRM